ncbi:MAG: hypothetical protein WHF31_16260 [Candidatus Dehalobacter alkaniphilus]
MKRIMPIMLCLSLVLGLTACGGGTSTQKSEETTVQTEQTVQSDNSKINVEKELFDVKLNLPASMFEGQDMEQVKKDALAEGVHEVTVNSDGSVTYIMSKSQHREMLNEIKKQIADSVTEFLADEENKATFKAVTFNGDYTEMTVKVDKSQYAAFSTLNLLGLEFTAVMYQVFNGVEDGKLKVNMLDYSTGEVVESYNFPLSE